MTAVVKHHKMSGLDMITLAVHAYQKRFNKVLSFVVFFWSDLVWLQSLGHWPSRTELETPYLASQMCSSNIKHYWLLSQYDNIYVGDDIKCKSI